jgi:WS/DGAT/MGAT family acyltransferase
MQQLSPMDAAFLYLENESTRAHGTFVWIYDASDCDLSAVTRRALLDHMRSRLHVSPIFTRKIHRLPFDFDYPYWVDDEAFELLYHVRELSLEKGARWPDFCRLVAEVHSRELDPSCPLWEMTLVRGLTGIEGLPEQSFAILGKFHHVAIDGATGMHIIEQIHDRNDSDDEPREASSRTARQPRLRESLLRAAIRNVGALDKGLALLGARSKAGSDNEDQPPAPDHSDPVDKLSPDEPVGIPQTLFNRAINTEATWDSRTYDLSEIKTMRTAVPGATVNDVLLTVVAGGLRRYLETEEGLPDTPMKAGCPMNIRTEGEAGAGGNMISAMIINMHTDVEDPLERLAAICRSSTTAKKRAAQGDTRRILDIASIVPAQAQALLGQTIGAVSGRLNRAVKFNCSVSNLPGPQRELHMLGGRLHTIGAAMPTMNGYGLFVGLTTCAGRLSICMSSCSDILPDSSALGNCMDQSYQDLRAATLRNQQRRKRKRKTN